MSQVLTLIGQVGADHMLMGSDWPVGEADWISLVQRCPARDDTGRAVWLGPGIQ